MAKKMIYPKVWLLLIVVFGIFNLSTALWVTLNINFRSWSASGKGISNQNISPIHFAENGNDFGWILYISDLSLVWTDMDESGETEDGTLWWIEVKMGDTTYRCTHEVQWYYYNSQRWERLWPLDLNTYTMFKKTDWGLTFSWWLYTSCRDEGEYNEEIEYCRSCSANLADCEWKFYHNLSEDDLGVYFSSEESEDGEESVEKKDFLQDCIDFINAEYADQKWIYGSVYHSYEGQDYYIIAWVEYSNSSLSPWAKIEASLVPTFQRFVYDRSAHPVGFLYDKNGWVWFVWCELNEGTMSDLIEALGTWDVVRCFTWNDDWTIAYTWGRDVGCPWKLECKDIWSAWQSLIWTIIEGLIWMSSKNHMEQIEDVNLTKTQYFSSANINSASLINYAKVAAESLCKWKWTNSPSYTSTDPVVCIQWMEDVAAYDYIGKTLIVKNWNVTIRPFTKNDISSDRAPYDIFVDGWNIIIDETTSEEADFLFVINKNWFYNDSLIIDFEDSVEDVYSKTNRSITWSSTINFSIWICRKRLKKGNRRKFK